MQRKFHNSYNVFLFSSLKIKYFLIQILNIFTEDFSIWVSDVSEYYSFEIL